MTTLKKILWVLMIAALFLIGGLSLFLFIQKDFIKNQSIKALNNQLNTKIDVGGAIDLTFLSSFPNITLSFDDVFIEDNLRDTDSLAALQNVRLQLNTWALLNKDVTIDGIYARDGFIHLYTDALGLNNYDIIKPKESNSASSLLQLNKIALNNVDIIYDDEMNKIYSHILSIESEIAGSFYEKDFNLNIQTDLFNHELFIDGTPLFTSKNVAGKLKLKYTGADGCISFDKNTLRIQNNNFLISGSVCSKTKTIDLKANAEGNNLKEALGLVPEEWLDVQEISGNGAFKVKASLVGNLKSPEIQLDFNIDDGSLQIEDQQVNLEALNLAGSFINTSENKQSIDMRHFSCIIDRSEIGGAFTIADLNKMQVEASLDGSVSTSLLNAYMPDGLRLDKGQLIIKQLALSIHQNKKDSTWQLTDVEGNIILDSLKGQVLELELPFSCQAELIGQENYLWANGLNLNIGENDLQFNGELRNLIGFIMKKEDAALNSLDVKGKLLSTHFNLNDFILDKKASSSKEKKEIVFPPIFGNVLITVDELIYQKLNVKDFQVDAIANGKAYTFHIMKGKSLGGDFGGKLLTNVNENDFEINLDCDIRNVDIQELFEAFDNFGQEDMGSENIRGTMNSQLSFSANWKDFSEFDADGFVMQSHLELKDGELINFAPLMSLSGKLELEQLEHLYFTDLAADITVKDQWIQIPMTTIQSNLLSLDAGGQHSFDNEIDYNLVLNLKNILAAKFKKNKTTEEEYVNDTKGGINLYISMTGTADDPIIKYDRQGVKDKMKQDFKEEKDEFKNLFKKGVESEFEKNEIQFEDLKEEDKYLDWEE